MLVRIRVPASGGQAELCSPYDPRLVEAIRSLPVRRWDPVARVWRIPADSESVRRAVDLVKKIPGIRVEIDGKLPDVQEEKNSVASSRAVSSDLEVPTKIPLMGFQRAGVEYLEAKGGRALIADEMGLGKTAQALGYLVRHPEALPALIVVPASVRVNWIREIEKFTALRPALVTGKTQLAALQRLGIPAVKALKGDWGQVAVINYDLLAKKMPSERFQACGFKTLILDEAHYIKEAQSLRTKAALALSRLASHVVLLSGTPILNRPRELWTLTQAINPSLFPKFFDFGIRYCAGHQRSVSRTRRVWDFSGVSNLDELERILRMRLMIRREKSQVLAELPPRRRVTVPLPLNGALGTYTHTASSILAELRQLAKRRADWKSALAKMSPEARRRHLAENAAQASEMARLHGVILGQLDRLRQAAALAKIEPAVDRIGDMAEEGEQVIVFAHHHEIEDRLVAALCERRVHVGLIRGTTEAAQRVKIEDLFQRGELRVLVLGLLAAGVGLNLQAASNCVFVELPWRPADIDQAEARAWRMGQKKPVTTFLLVGLGTLDEQIAQVIDAKRAVANSVLGEAERTLEDDALLDGILEGLVRKRP